MSLRWPPKDPDETLDYSLKWADELSRLNDEIFESSWRIEGEDNTLAFHSKGDGIYNSKDITYVWLEGGTPGVTYDCINTIETDMGRIYERTVRLQVRQK